MRNRKAISAALLALATAFAGAVHAHEVRWTKHEPRQASFGKCAKGACAKRVVWGSSKPHHHVGNKVVFDISRSDHDWPG